MNKIVKTSDKGSISNQAMLSSTGTCCKNRMLMLPLFNNLMFFSSWILVFFIFLIFKNIAGLLWLRLYLPMQGTRVRPLVWDDSAGWRAPKSVRHNYWACMPYSLWPATREATAMRNCEASAPGARPQRPSTVQNKYINSNKRKIALTMHELAFAVL